MFEEDLTGKGRNLQFLSIGPLASPSTFNLINGVTGYKIKVVSYCVTADPDNTITWRSGSTLLLSGPLFLLNNARNGVSMIGSPTAHLLETAVGNGLALQTSTPNSINGHITYFLEKPVRYS